MSELSYVVLPVSGSGPHPNQETAEVASTIQHALYERSHPQPEQSGPLKQVFAHPDGLYKYINWSDPTRTLSLYLGLSSILFGAHYLPLTQVALKGGVTTLGLVSITEFASRSLSGNSVSARLRPKEYKTIPEPTLNATLKDIHDLVQYVVVQAQRIVFGHDLDKTFATFLGAFGLFWLSKLVSPFWFAVLALNSIFIAPIVFSEPGRRAARNAGVRAQEVGNVAVDKAGEVGHDGKVKAAELSSRGQQAAVDLASQARNTASNIADKAGEVGHDGKVKAADLSSRGQQTASNLSSQARGTASDWSGAAAQKGRQVGHDGNVKVAEMSSRGKQTASDFSLQARDTASNISGAAYNMSGTAADNVKQLPQKGANAVNRTEDFASLTYGGAKEYVNNPPAPPSNYTNGHTEGYSNDNRSVTDGASSGVPHLAEYTNGIDSHTAPEVQASKQPDLINHQHPVSSFSAQTGGTKTGAINDMQMQFAAGGYAATAPRDGAHSTTYRA